MDKYDHQKIEAKWQKKWLAEQANRADPPTGGPSSKPKYYCLIEFPYPSGDGLHVGHPRPYIGLDIIARKRRAEGFNVLYPIGWDAFGLPTENYAIKTGQPPAEVTKKNTDNFRRQIQSLGISFDWSREINTTDPKYYKWTQWLFLQFYKRGLAYKAKTEINWCPKCLIGLANEEAVGGVCERCGTAVIKKEKEQWMLAITKYADRLDKDLDEVNYRADIKLQQRNWIGRSEGAEFSFQIINPTPSPLPEGEGEFGYQTTDAKTWQLLQDKAKEMRQNPTEAEEKLWQVLRDNSTEHHFRRQQIIGKFIVDFVCLEKRLVVEVDGDIHDYQKEADDERTQFLERKGFKVIRFKNEQVVDDTQSVWVEINAALKALSFGEGLGGVDVIKVFTTRPDTIFGVTFVAVSAKFAREKLGLTYEFPKTEGKLGEAIEKVGYDTGLKAINPASGAPVPVWVVNYVLDEVGTGAIMGVPAHDERDFEFAKKYGLEIKEIELESKEEIIKKFGQPKTTYKLRDWIFSRQRYWGEPIPMVWCEKCALNDTVGRGWQPVPETDLPVELPPVEKFQPGPDGESPLAAIDEWVNTTCPKCGGPAKRETDVMPNWAGSSWYYLRYCDPHNDQEFASAESLEYFTPVDWYNGGMEHTTLHLLYSRFWHKFLFDLKLVPTSEPYAKRTSHGLILAEGGAKMSKSKGNVVNPDEIVKNYGADTLRVYEMFMGPFDQAIAWSTESLMGPRRFLEKVWKLGDRVELGVGSEEGDKIQSLLNQTIKKVSEDIESLKFNTAISSLMVLVNELEKAEAVMRSDYLTLLKLLAPFAPHLTAELWESLGERGVVSEQKWPELSGEMAVGPLTIIVQVNGVKRGEMTVEGAASDESLAAQARALPALAKWLAPATIKRTVVVPGRLVNFVL